MLKKRKELKDKEFIDQSLYNKMRLTDSPAPRFYRLPKMDKPNIPIRKIVSYSDTPLYNQICIGHPNYIYVNSKQLSNGTPLSQLKTHW